MSQDGRRRVGLWLADHALALGGAALVALGAAGFPVALPLGWTALVFFGVRSCLLQDATNKT